MNLRSRRMDAEWKLLEELAAANSSVFSSIDRSHDEFRITTRGLPAWVKAGAETRLEMEHQLYYMYPRFYPALPLEGYFVRPIQHINVNPKSGFVCLWQDYRPSQTIVDAILITCAIMAGRIANHDPAHRMQACPKADVLPLPSLSLPESFRVSLHCNPNGRLRLSPPSENQDTRSECLCVFSS